MNDAAAGGPPVPEAAVVTPGPAPGASVAPTGVFAELDRILFTRDGQSLGRVLGRVAHLARSVLPELTLVSVTLVQDGHATTAAFAGSLAAQLDERQYELGSGPCLDAALVGGTILVDTADPHSTYPQFSRMAAQHHITQVLAVGLPTHQRTVGALNMYVSSPQPLSTASVELAQTFARHAAVVVANAVLHHDALEEARHVQEAMKTRAAIEQAKGILMATRHCTAEQAFGLLTRASQQQNRKLRDIADDLVNRRGVRPQAP
ncbi:GAF and ANTAR domain-containing protein [Microlunatus capsulatus]|uniref:GAF domain-containing protein n=2 Tax=Microlunatus capsulatus TaxID=99117 RepID=A0ABS4Z7J8_9ACTN|nr:GAF and ANTAR domain-containing protein [Microlunatus capsulatus]MBP2417026.1 GAF domain-containing protein [Microlunatus capsulatus]